MNYAGFLTWLLAIGPRLPKILELLNALFAELAPAEANQNLELIQVSDEELEAEQKVVMAMSAGDAMQPAFDGSRIRGIFKFLTDSGLLDILVTLFAKKA